MVHHTFKKKHSQTININRNKTCTEDKTVDKLQKIYMHTAVIYRISSTWYTPERWYFPPRDHSDCISLGDLGIREDASYFVPLRIHRIQIRQGSPTGSCLSCICQPEYANGSDFSTPAMPVPHQVVGSLLALEQIHLVLLTTTPVSLPISCCYQVAGR